MTVPNLEALKAELKKLAKRESLSDDDSIDDFFGGNIDDAYSGGLDDGESSLARHILNTYFDGTLN